MEANRGLPSGTDLVFTGLSENSAPWLLTLSENGLRTYIKTEQTLTRDTYTSREAMSLVRPGKMALSPGGEKIAIGDVWAPSLAILERAGSAYRPTRSIRIPDALLTEQGKQEAERGDIYLPNPVWVENGGRLLLYAFGYLPSSDFIDGQPDSLSNRIAVFDWQTAAVLFTSLGNDIDASLCIECELESMEGKLSQGLEIDLDVFVRALGHLRRTLETLGIKREARDVTTLDAQSRLDKLLDYAEEASP
jgi:hypothetical protein